jgi:Spy/CpxP family protein refolding chaperone
MNRNAAIVVLAVAMIASPLAPAQNAPGGVTDLQALRTAVLADKKAFVASTLALTDAEAKKFWPIYDDYQRDLDAANRKRTLALEGVIALNKPMSDLYARNLARDLIAADDAEARARKTMQNRVLKALPATKAVRYLQLETKIRAVQAYEVAAALPLVR